MDTRSSGCAQAAETEQRGREHEERRTQSRNGQHRPAQIRHVGPETDIYRAEEKSEIAGEGDYGRGPSATRFVDAVRDDAHQGGKQAGGADGRDRQPEYRDG